MNQILVDSNNVVTASGYFPTEQVDLCYTISDYNFSLLDIPGTKIYDPDTGNITIIPPTELAIPPTLSTATISAYKEQVMNALVNNIGQTVTVDTVSALLQYLGSLP